MKLLAAALPLGFALSAAAPPSSHPPPAQAPDEAPRARLYTNADLERVHPRSGETGALSQPAVAPAAPVDRPEPRRGEEYWRREAAKVRKRQRSLAERAEALRARLADRRESERKVSRRGGASASTAPLAALRAKLAALELRQRQLDDELAERARRAGALPGWLR